MKSFKLATVTLLVAAAALSTSAFAKDGTYTAQEVGRNGAVKVQVIVKGNKIESVFGSRQTASLRPLRPASTVISKARSRIGRPTTIIWPAGVTGLVILRA